MKSQEIKDQEFSKENEVGFREDRFNIPVLKYFWQASPLAKSRRKTIPKFLRRVDVFENFSDYELRIMSKFMHQRDYSNDEMIMKEGDSGFGFYLIFDGKVSVFSKHLKVEKEKSEICDQFVTELSSYEYFGELSLLEKKDKRNATIYAINSVVMLAIYKPDFEELIEKYPVVGAKFLQALGSIIARRFTRVARELKNLKFKISELESTVEQ